MKDPSIMTTGEISLEVKRLKERLDALVKEWERRVTTTYEANWDEE